MGLDGPSRTIIVEPQTLPDRPEQTPDEAPAADPVETPVEEPVTV